MNSSEKLMSAKIANLEKQGAKLSKAMSEFDVFVNDSKNTDDCNVDLLVEVLGRLSVMSEDICGKKLIND